MCDDQVQGSPKGAGFILWLTGLSGAGKSTLARALRPALEAERRVEVLDGDEAGVYFAENPCFTREDRDTGTRRIGFAARLLARNGVAVIVAAISPYAETRAEMRALAEAEGIPFAEVFVSATAGCLVERDVKGAYARVLAGEVPIATGLADVYEESEAPEVVVHTDREDVGASRDRIVAALRRRGLVRGELAPVRSS